MNNLWILNPRGLHCVILSIWSAKLQISSTCNPPDGYIVFSHKSWDRLNRCCRSDFVININNKNWFTIDLTTLRNIISDSYCVNLSSARTETCPYLSYLHRPGQTEAIILGIIIYWQPTGHRLNLIFSRLHYFILHHDNGAVQPQTTTLGILLQKAV